MDSWRALDGGRASVTVDLGLPGALPIPAAGCDCRVCPFFIDNPAAVEPVCSGCNTDCAYCGCARAEADADGTGCATCPIRCGSRTDISGWMRDVGGTLLFDDIAIDGRLPAGLPRFTPMVDGSGIPELDADLHWPAYAVGLRRVFSPTTASIYPRFRDTTAAAALGLRPGQFAVLVGYGEDPLVEAFWTRRHVDRLAYQLHAQGWDLVLAPNYSMYGNQPRTEHLINFRRNLLIAAELASAGIAAVPNLYWFRLEDLDRYLHWLADTTPPAIAVNLQTFRTDADWERMALPGLTYLASALPADLPVVMTGASRAHRIRTLVDLFGARLHLIAQNPLQYARHGAVMTAEGRVDQHAQLGDLFAANVRYYATQLDAGGPR